MVDIPQGLDGRGSALGDGWYVLARPEGRRCLVIASKHRTTSRALHGEYVHRHFESALPAGTILECVFVARTATYYAVDVLCWGRQNMYDCTAEFRFFWLHSQLADVGAPADRGGGAFAFANVPYYECDAAGLAAAYSAPVPYLKDGLLFFAKRGHYDPGLTPLVLLWKDAATTRYFSPADDHVFAVLQTDARGARRTCDSVAVAAVDGGARQAPRAGDLARYEIVLCGGGSPRPPCDEEDADDAPPVRGVAARFDKACSLKRPLADSWSKIVFALRHRTAPLTIETILANITKPLEGSPSE